MGFLGIDSPYLSAKVLLFFHISKLLLKIIWQRAKKLVFTRASQPPLPRLLASLRYPLQGMVLTVFGVRPPHFYQTDDIEPLFKGRGLPVFGVRPPHFYQTDDIEPLFKGRGLPVFGVRPPHFYQTDDIEPLFKGRRKRGCRNIPRTFDGPRVPKRERQEERLSLHSFEGGEVWREGRYPP